MGAHEVAVAVLQIFAEAQQLYGGGRPGHAFYFPPWRDLLPNGRLGPEFLPRSPVTGGPVRYDVAAAEHREGRYALSGGLWDHRLGAAVTHQPSRRERYDEETMADYLARHSHQVPRLELEAYVAFWVERRSYSNAASHLGLAEATIKDAVKRLRLRAKSKKLDLVADAR